MEGYLSRSNDLLKTFQAKYPKLTNSSIKKQKEKQNKTKQKNKTKTDSHPNNQNK